MTGVSSVVLMWWETGLRRMKQGTNFEDRTLSAGRVLLVLQLLRISWIPVNVPKRGLPEEEHVK